MTADFPRLLDGLLTRKDLSEDEAHLLMDKVLKGHMGPERMAAFVTAVRAKGVAVDELVGFAGSMREHSHDIDAGTTPVLDTCGTGGAPTKTLNVSTAAAFVLAAGGVVVAKHGNRSVTRPSGSADVLEAGGAKLDLAPHDVESVLRKVGIAFLFAPTFHPAMRHAAPVRQALGIKTVFNLLGPLTNPAEATHQVLGVYDPKLLPTMAEALTRLGCKGGYVLHGAPGYDEATPCGPVDLVPIREGAPGESFTLDPRELGIAAATPSDLRPVVREQAAKRVTAVLAGDETGAFADTVALNAALGFAAVGAVSDIPAGLEKARDVLAAGSGKEKWDAYVAATCNP